MSWNVPVSSPIGSWAVPLDSVDQQQQQQWQPYFVNESTRSTRYPPHSEQQQRRPNQPIETIAFYPGALVPINPEPAPAPYSGTWDQMYASPGASSSSSRGPWYAQPYSPTVTCQASLDGRGGGWANASKQGASGSRSTEEYLVRSPSPVSARVKDPHVVPLAGAFSPVLESPSTSTGFPLFPPSPTVVSSSPLVNYSGGKAPRPRHAERPLGRKATNSEKWPLCDCYSPQEFDGKAPSKAKRHWEENCPRNLDRHGLWNFRRHQRTQHPDTCT
ncbi:hypothetical protein FRB99_000119 [Tulasnella sp. 403]|nr:hypothetical protein FRB99_000119 [Tulasnella sp. 403]